MTWFGFYAAKGFVDLVKGELAPSGQRGESYLHPDERARQRANALLAADTSIDATNVEVRVLSGVLRLSGRVPDESARARVNAHCKGLSGVTRIEDELTVA
ncbi:MAG TPA: BON domain-containing protein [Polyangiales bacterium]|nr:BON domain-containing protein [Polyangiales bacterium]